MKMQKKLLKVASVCALKLTAVTVNSACTLVMHQPKLPKAALKLKK